jgi:hypothetical protein
MARYRRIPQAGAAFFVQRTFLEKKLPVSIENQHMHRPMTKTFLVHFVAAGTANNTIFTIDHRQQFGIFESMGHSMGSETASLATA